MKRTPVKSGVVLPPGTKNKCPDSTSCRINNAKTFSGCTYREGQILITKEEWSLIECE